ncbi:MAG: type II CRISPR RNA-guided endonuclease Cas9 [Clostridiales bacterium]|jgi:CRISPR-associated endonuclease Csn1|nr:type II CRISPR RNA-guided endonuclease Cas9 [Clostridiales bacterium]
MDGAGDKKPNGGIDKDKFYIGLDLGTSSAGFAATDGEYNVLKCGSKYLMGVRLFEEAKTSAERRIKRANKVRKERRKQRILLLQEMFYDEVNKVDPLFFIRLSASSLWEDDKKKVNEELDLNSLFSDKEFKDRTYFHKYKTIYHLRNDLMNRENWQADKKPDIRLVYLACHHILKHRGHFLWKADDINFSAQGGECLERLSENLKAVFNDGQDEDLSGGTVGTAFQFRIPSDIDGLLEIFKDKKTNGSDKKYKLKEIFFDKAVLKEYKDTAEALVTAITGGDFRLDKLFEDIEKSENKYSFNGDWEENARKIAQELDDDDKFAVVETLKEIYDFAELKKLLNDETGISAAMVKNYEKHSEDLKRLKAFVKTELKNQYYKIFRSVNEFKKAAATKPNAGNYANYIGSNWSEGKSILKKVEKEGFYSFLSEIFAEHFKGERLENMTETGKKNYEYIKTEMENGTFLPKLRTKNNGAVPFQLHKHELNTILDNAAEYYGFLKAEDGGVNGAAKTVKDKIISLLTFRVPFYAGRLNVYNPDGKRHVWAERKINGVKITPWTFDSVIDEDKSAENFIRRMLAKCTYIRAEDVLPKYSLFYSKYAVLNELNNVKIRGSKIDVQLKQNIYNDLFLKEKNITANRLLKYLTVKVDKSLTAEDLSGFDKDGKGFNSSLSPHICSRPIVEKLKETCKIPEEYAVEIIENVILWRALLSDKDMLVRKIKKEYAAIPDGIIKDLKGLNGSAFGRLSKRFLTEEFVSDGVTGEYTSIINLLWNTNENLMEILYDSKYNIQNALAQMNGNSNGGFSYADIEESYGAPSVKRAVWEACRVCGELIDLNEGRIPDKIFIEVTRETGDKKKGKSGDKKKGKRTKTRKEQIKELYKEIKKQDIGIAELEKELEKQSDSRLRKEKLFLYFTQCGKCAYSGEPIKIENLDDDNIYDIDHIIPRTLRKDGSLDNKALVRKDLNNKKSDKYPLIKTEEIYKNISKLTPMWAAWKKAKLISVEKFDRLTRTTELTEDEIKNFLARQLNFTGQSAILAASLFKRKFGVEQTPSTKKGEQPNKKPEIVYSKGGNVGDFRQKFNIIKCRDVNDLHHAYDAYLNIVVGNVYNERFNHNINLWKNEEDKFAQYNQNHLFEYNVKDAWRANSAPKPIRPKEENFPDKDQYRRAMDEYRRGFAEWLDNSPTIKTVKGVVSKPYYTVTKKVVENKGAFYDETIYGVEVKQKKFKEGGGLKKIKDAAVPIKGCDKNPRGDMRKYGYFKSENPAYFMIAEHTVTKNEGKKKCEFQERTFISVPILDKSRIEKDALKFLSEDCGLVNPKIIASKVYKYTLFEMSGTPVRLAGFVEWHNAVEWFASGFAAEYIKLLAKYKKYVEAKIFKENEVKDKTEITVSGDGVNNTKKQTISKRLNLDLFNEIKAQLEKNIYKGNKVLYGKLTGEHADKFKDLDIISQIKILAELMKVLKSGAGRGNLSDIGASGSFGRFTGSAKIDAPLVMIKESVTGVKTKRTQIYPFKGCGYKET